MKHSQDARKDFAKWAAENKAKLQSLSGEPVAEKPVNYGVQLKGRKNGQEAIVTLYCGKKGFTMTFGGKATPFRKEVERAFEELPFSDEGTGESASERSLLEDVPGFDGVWAGSDESGKGDFFGPLAVAAVAVDRRTAAAFRRLGVKDSKSLTDAQIHTLAEKIREGALACTVLALPPELYNRRYAWFKERGGNLNTLLANGHVNALSGVLRKCPACHFALVDRFSLHNRISERLEQQFPGLTVRQVPRAEADMAVAAASILARDEFVRIMEGLEKEAGMPLPKGGGTQATQTAKRLASTLGSEQLAHFVKLHFANAQKL